MNKKNSVLHTKDFEKIVELDTSKTHNVSKNYWQSKGMELFATSRWNDAIECFSQESDTNPNFDSEYYKGICYYKLSKPNEALECFNKSWELKSAEFLHLKGHSKSLSKFKEFERMIDKTNKLASITSIPTDFWLLKGTCLYMISNYTIAAESFKTGYEETHNPIFLYFYSRCLLKLHNHNQCIKILKNAIKEDPAIRKMLLVDPDFFELKNNPEFLKITDNFIL